MRILIADDEYWIRQDIKKIVESLYPDRRHVIVGEAVNGKDMIEKILIYQPDLAIVDIQMDHLRGLLAQQNISFEITDEAKELLARRGFNPIYGARPLKRVIRQMVENPLSKLLLAQKFIDGDTIKIGVKDDEIEFSK